MRITLTVNGTRHEVDDVWEGESLLYALRERMGLPGSKNLHRLPGRAAGVFLPRRRRPGRRA